MPNKVLIADDDFNHLNALRIRLESEGFEVFCAQDSYNAVQLIQRERPDALILDINMPAGNGFTVHQRLAKMDNLGSPPVIYLTGERSERVEAMAKAHDAFAIMYKPCDSKDVIANVHLAINFRNSSEAA